MDLNKINFILTNLVLIVTFILIALEKIPRVVIALLGASFLLITQIISQEEAFEVIDFNVIFLLVGMMIIVNVLKHTGFMRYLAIYITKLVKGNISLLLIYFSILTAILSAFLDNVTTVIIIASITLSISKELKINPIPLLISEIIASNIGGTATLIGDPPNIMIGSAAGLDFNQFLLHIAPFIVLIFPLVIFTLYLFFRNEIKVSHEALKYLESLKLDQTITNKPLLRKTLIIFAFVLLGFIFHGPLKIEAGTVALAGASFLLIFENSKLLWDDVEWATIFFFIGLFIIVGAVEKVGTITYISSFIFNASGGDFNIATIAILWLSALFSGFVDNIPYTATIIPAIENLSTHFKNINPLWWALSLGTGIGANITTIGAAANVIITDLAKKSGHEISFLKFFIIGGTIAFEILILATIYIYLRYLT